MKIFAWLLVAGIGLAVTVSSERFDRSATAPKSMSSGVIVAGRSRLQTFDEPIPFPSIKARFVQLPASGISAMLAVSAGGSADRVRNLQFQISEKLIEVSFTEAGIDQSTLAWGTLPRVGTNEVLSGADLARRDKIQVAETNYTVTGGLPRAAGLLARSYVLPADERAGEHDSELDAAFHPAVLIPLDIGELSNRQIAKQLAERFPPKEFDRMACVGVVGPRTFYVTLLGEGLLLLGGSGVFIALYRAASRVRSGILRDPLAALSSHRRLDWTVHLVYFGLYLISAALVFQAPDLRTTIQAVIHTSIREGGGLLQVAGSAYLKGHIAWTAFVTFAINFFLGSLLFLTLPSCVIPGSGALLAGIRAVAWGLVLAPATLPQALNMVPHCGTVLLEGEGYILAAFFGLMVPLSLRRHPTDAGTQTKGGYGRAVLLNLKGSLLVALVLAVAATYEATEVILMLKHAGAV